MAGRFYTKMPGAADDSAPAAGGIRTREQAESMISAGATRIATSSGVALVSVTGYSTPKLTHE